MTNTDINPAAAPLTPLPTRVPIQPQPFAVDLDVVETTKGPQIGMRVQTFFGVQIYMLTPDQAKALGEQLRNAGTRAGLGLTVIGRP